MARIKRDADGNVIEESAAQPVLEAEAAPAVDVYEVMVDAIGADAVKGDLVTPGDVTWDIPFLVANHSVREAPEYMQAYHVEGLRSSTRPVEGQPSGPVLLANAPQTQAPVVVTGSVPETPQRAGGPTAAEAAAATPDAPAPATPQN